MKVTLKALRVIKGWTQEEAAEKWGITKETLRNYEKFVTFPNVETIKKIIETTNVKYEDIIFLQENDAKSGEE